jgi:hypothetical protein
MSQVGFERDIRPLFRSSDVEAMEFAFELTSYEAVVDNAAAIYERLDRGEMPCDSPWPREQVDLFSQWMTAGFAR